MGTPAIVVPGPLESGATHRGESNETAGTGASHGEGEEPMMPPYLLLLVPSGSVDWGLEGKAEGYGQDRNAWLEVGCRLTSVRSVDNVRFSV